MRAFLIILAFLAGIAGGTLSQNLPFFVFQQSKGPVSSTLEVRQVIIKDNEQLVKAVSKVKDVILQVTTQTASNKVLEGSGLVLTSDGLLVTLAELVPRGSTFFFKSQDRAFNFQVLKRDLSNNLALVKLEASSLATASFNSELKLGEQVFIVGQVNGQKRVNQGIVSAFDKDLIITNIIEDEAMSGSVVFTLDSKIAGLAFVEKGRVKIIPVSILRQFSGL